MRNRLIARPRWGSRASITRCPTSERSAACAVGTIASGATRASLPPALTAVCRYHGKKSGTCCAISANACPAVALSSGRITRSTKPTVNPKPWGSLRTPASCWAEASDLILAARANQVRTCWIAWSSSCQGAISEVCCEVVGMKLPSVAPKLELPHSIRRCPDLRVATSGEGSASRSSG